MSYKITYKALDGMITLQVTIKEGTEINTRVLYDYTVRANRVRQYDTGIWEKYPLTNDITGEVRVREGVNQFRNAITKLCKIKLEEIKTSLMVNFPNNEIIKPKGFAGNGQITELKLFPNYKPADLLDKSKNVVFESNGAPVDKMTSVEKQYIPAEVIHYMAKRGYILKKTVVYDAKLPQYRIQFSDSKDKNQYQFDIKGIDISVEIVEVVSNGNIMMEQEELRFFAKHNIPISQRQQRHIVLPDIEVINDSVIQFYVNKGYSIEKTGGNSKSAIFTLTKSNQKYILSVDHRRQMVDKSSGYSKAKLDKQELKFFYKLGFSLSESHTEGTNQTIEDWF